MDVVKAYAISCIDPGLLGESAGDVASAVSHLTQIERENPSLMREDWISIPLINATGKAYDHDLEPQESPGLPTSYLDDLPWTRNAIGFIEVEGLCIEHARLLALRPLGMFWPHKDVHPFFRLLLPVYADGGECLYLLGGDSYLAEVGKFYYLQPDVYHAALNLSDHMRFVLCLDVTSDRRAVDFVAKRAQRPEARGGRLALGEEMQRSIKKMVTHFGESEPLLAGKLAVALGCCLMDGSVDVIQSLIYEGLSKCSQEEMAGDTTEELKRLLGILKKHPSYPAVEHSGAPGLFDAQEESTNSAQPKASTGQ